MKRSRPAGFSLLEVLLATSILLGSAIVLGELASIGRQHVNSAEETANAQLICQTKLNEILAGIARPESIEKRTVENQPGWVYSVDVEPIGQAGMPSGPQLGLALLRVTVSQDVPDDQRGRQFSLVHWIRDPHAPSDTETGPPWPESPSPGPGFLGGFRP